MDKEIVLDKFIANRLEAMLEQATGEKVKVLKHLRDGVVERTKDLEEKQKDLPKAPFISNCWDIAANKLHHDTLSGWPYEDRASPEEEDDSEGEES